MSSQPMRNRPSHSIPQPKDIMPCTNKLVLLSRSELHTTVRGRELPHTPHPSPKPHPPPPPSSLPPPTRPPTADFTTVNKQNLQVVYQRQKPLIQYIVEQYRRDEVRILKLLIEMKEREENQKTHGFMKKGEGIKRDVEKGECGCRQRGCCQEVKNRRQKNCHAHNHHCQIHGQKKEALFEVQPMKIKILSPPVFRAETLIKQNKFINYVETRAKSNIATRQEMQQVLDILRERLEFLVTSGDFVLKKHPGLLYKFRDYDEAVDSLNRMQSRITVDMRLDEGRNYQEHVAKIQKIQEEELSKSPVASDNQKENQNAEFKRPMTTAAKISTSPNIRIRAPGELRRRYSRITKLDSLQFANQMGPLQNTFTLPLTPSPINNVSSASRIVSEASGKHIQIKTFAMIQQLQQIQQIIEPPKKPTLRSIKFRNESKMTSFAQLHPDHFTKSSKKTIGSRKFTTPKRRTSMEEEVDKDKTSRAKMIYGRKKVVEFAEDGKGREGGPREPARLGKETNKEASKENSPIQTSGDIQPSCKGDFEMNMSELSKLKKRQKKVVKLQRNNADIDDNMLHESLESPDKSLKLEEQLSSQGNLTNIGSMNLNGALKNLHMRKRKHRQKSIIKPPQPSVDDFPEKEPTEKQKQTVTYLKINPYSSFISNKQLLAKQCLKLQQLLSGDTESIKELSSMMRRCSKRADLQKSQEDQMYKSFSPSSTQLQFFKSSLNILSQIRKGLQGNTKTQLLQFLQHFLKCTLVREHTDKELIVSKGSFSIDKNELKTLDIIDKKVSREFEDKLLDFSRLWPRLYDEAIMQQSASRQTGVMELCRRFF